MEQIDEKTLADWRDRLSKSYPELRSTHDVGHFFDEEFPFPILQSIKDGEYGLSSIFYEYIDSSSICRHICAFNYQDNSYSEDAVAFLAFCDRAYSSVLNVERFVTIDSGKDSMAISFAREINDRDLLHQIWYELDSHTLHVRRQYSVAPSLSSIDGFIHFLKELRDYTDELSKLDTAAIEADRWKRFAINPKSCATAEQMLFDGDCALLWLGGSLRDKNNEGISESPMFSTVFGPPKGSIMMGMVVGAYEYCRVADSEATITTYAFAPYMAKLSGHVKLDADSSAALSQEQIQDYCDKWNASMHFSLSWLSWHRDEDGSLVIDITMSCLLAEQRNAETVYRILGSYAYTVLNILKRLGKTKKSSPTTNGDESDSSVTWMAIAFILAAFALFYFLIF